MNTFKNIILVLPILFFGCEDNKNEDSYTELEWILLTKLYNLGAPVELQYMRYFYYYTNDVGIDTSFDIADYEDQLECSWIHYYEDDNYLNFGEFDENGNRGEVYTLNLDVFVNIQYGVKE